MPSTDSISPVPKVVDYGYLALYNNFSTETEGQKQDDDGIQSFGYFIMHLYEFNLSEFMQLYEGEELIQLTFDVA